MWPTADYAAGSFQVSTKSLDAFLDPFLMMFFTNFKFSTQKVLIRFARMRSQIVYKRYYRKNYARVLSN